MDSEIQLLISEIEWKSTMFFLVDPNEAWSSESGISNHTLNNAWNEPNFSMLCGGMKVR